MSCGSREAMCCPHASHTWGGDLTAPTHVPCVWGMWVGLTQLWDNPCGAHLAESLLLTSFSLSLSLPLPLSFFLPPTCLRSTDQLMLTKVFYLKRRIPSQCSLTSEVYCDSYPLPGEGSGFQTKTHSITVTGPSSPQGTCSEGGGGREGGREWGREGGREEGREGGGMGKMYTPNVHLITTPLLSALLCPSSSQ